MHSECHVLDEFINWLSLTVSLAILYLTKYGTTSILFCLRKIQVTFITESYLSMIENLRCQRHVKFTCAANERAKLLDLIENICSNNRTNKKNQN